MSANVTIQEEEESSTALHFYSSVLMDPFYSTRFWEPDNLSHYV